MKLAHKIILAAALAAMPACLHAQKYGNGVIDKTVAVIGNEVILISDIESEVQRLRGLALDGGTVHVEIVDGIVDRHICGVLEDDDVKFAETVERLAVTALDVQF